MTVVKAVKKFRTLTANKRPPVLASILDESDGGRFSLPPGQYAAEKPPLEKSQSLNLDDRKAVESALVVEGVHREIQARLDSEERIPQTRRQPSISSDSDSSSDEDNLALRRLRGSIDRTVEPNELPPFRSSVYNSRTVDDVGRRGQARDPLAEQLFLKIGPSTFAGHSSQDYSGESFSDEEYIVSESPGAADVDIYETAYRDEIERIMAQAAEENKEPQVYLTRRVDEKLLQLSGLAGKIAAHGEDAKSQFKDYAQFKERKARVTEVSKALREAAKAEYEKRRQERRTWIQTAKTEKAEKSRLQTDRTDEAATPVENHPSEMTASPPVSPQPLESSSSWRAKAVDRGRNARTAFSGLVSSVKKSRKGRDDIT